MSIRLLLALAIVTAPAARAQPAVVPLSTPVEELARDALGSLPGMAVAGAWREGRASYAGAFSGKGIATPAASGPRATLFEIGSISKVFTGLLLAQATAVRRATRQVARETPCGPVSPEQPATVPMRMS